MKKFGLTPKLCDLLIEMHLKGGKITKKDCSSVRGPYFYINIWFLRDLGLIKKVQSKPGNAATWILSKKGEEVAKRLKEINEIMGKE